MTDRPIIFSASMVKALLNGKKFQSRRVLKPQFKYMLKDRFERWKSFSEEHWQWMYAGVFEDGTGCIQSLPYKPGDRLWVREKWSPVPATAYRASTGVEQTVDPADPDRAAVYAAGWERSAPLWRSPIHMPRWASRLTLIVTDVRVQRVQEITPDDCRAEGHPIEPARSDDSQVHDDAARDWFMDLWDSLNGKKPGCAWADNPWVIALSFEAHHQNIDQLQRPGKPADRREK